MKLLGESMRQIQKAVILLVFLALIMVLSGPVFAANLGLTPDQFKKQYNLKIQTLIDDPAYSKQFLIGPLSIEEGEVKDGGMFAFSKDLAMVVTVEKNTGKIESLMLVASGSQAVITNAMLVYGWMMSVCKPGMGKERGAILQALLEKLPERKMNIKTVGDIKYLSSFGKEIGLVLAIEAAG